MLMRILSSFSYMFILMRNPYVWNKRCVEVLDGMVTPNVGVKLKTLLDVPTGHVSAHRLPVDRSHLQSWAQRSRGSARPNSGKA